MKFYVAAVFLIHIREVAVFSEKLKHYGLIKTKTIKNARHNIYS